VTFSESCSIYAMASRSNNLGGGVVNDNPELEVLSLQVGKKISQSM